MKILFIGAPPLDSKVFPFARYAEGSVLDCETSIHYIKPGLLTLVRDLRRECLEALPRQEKVVICSDSANHAALANEMRRLYPGLEIYGVATRYDSHRRPTSYDSKVDAWLDDSNVPVPSLAPTAEMPFAPASGRLLLYQGPITKEAKMDEIVGYVASHLDCSLLVCGTGKGRWTMPAVRLSRQEHVRDRVHWAGDAYDDVILKATPDTVYIPTPEPDEVKLMSYAAQCDVACDFRPEKLERRFTDTSHFFDSLLTFFRAL